MLLEAANLYLKTSKHALTSQNRLINKSIKLQLLIALFIPFVISFLGLAFGEFGKSYVEKLPNKENKICFVRKNIIVFSLFIPLTLIISFNFIVIVKVARYVFKVSKSSTKKVSNSKQINSALKAVLLMAPSLGTTWFWKLFYCK